MGRESEVFVIDGDTVMRAQSRPTPPQASPAGTATVLPAPEPRPAREATGERSGSTKAAGAASLSMWVWGSGQWVNGDRDLAVLLVLCQGLVASLHYLVIETWGPIRRMAHIFFIEEWELLLGAAAIDFWIIFLLLFNVSQAYRSAERQKGRFPGLRKPWLSGLGSLIVPGWGQLLNGQLGKGLFFLFAFVLQGYLIAFYMLTPLYRTVSNLDPNQVLLRDVITYGKLVLALTAQLWLLSIYDAVLVSRYTRNRAR